jgi:hypothetical protein
VTSDQRACGEPATQSEALTPAEAESRAGLEQRQAASRSQRQIDAGSLSTELWPWRSRPEVNVALPSNQPLPEEWFDHADFLETRAFYEIMQAYRHTRVDAAPEFEHVKRAIRTFYRAADETPEPCQHWSGAIECPRCRTDKSTARQSGTQNGNSPATCDHLYRYTTPRVCIYCGLADDSTDVV